MNGFDVMSEADLDRMVHGIAKAHGWLAFHARPAIDHDGKHRTVMTGDPGFPDWVFARNGLVLFTEHKTMTGRLGKGQPEWRDALGEHWRLWRPSDKYRIEEELR